MLSYELIRTKQLMRQMGEKLLSSGRANSENKQLSLGVRPVSTSARKRGGEVRFLRQAQFPDRVSY